MNRTASMPAPAVSTLLCIGHSHVACVAQAAAKTGIALQAMNFWGMPGAVEQADGKVRLSADLEQQLQRHEGAVFSLVGGAAHGVLGMLVHPRRFDVVLPEQPGLALDPPAEVLPALAVQRLLEALSADYLALMTQVRHACSGAFFHIEPPPPYADALRMHADMPWDMYPGMCHEISPVAMRYKLWRLHSRILARWCTENDATLVSCPAEAMTAEGYLQEACYGDGAHANDVYGTLVLQQMKRLA